MLKEVNGMSKNVSFKVNNFDLIRLIAALQVVFFHSLVHLHIDKKWWYITEFTDLFPGVPIFFFVSGFLISKSYENNSIIREYAQNRILRIYPGLFVCTFLALLSVSLTGYFANLSVGTFHYLVWIVGQITFVQFYNPDFMRGYGTGVLNGSLWTIAVELQFYMLVPLLYWMLGKINKNRENMIIAFMIVLFMGVNVTYNVYGQNLNRFLFMLWGVTFSPWFYMFLIGVYFQKNFEKIFHVLSGKFFYMLLIYMVYHYLSKYLLGGLIGNNIQVLTYMVMAPLIFSFAYSFPTLGTILLRKNDVSYGVYIYHIPIINLFVYYGYISNILFLISVIVITIIMASLSWGLIEKPAISMKKHASNPLGTTVITILAAETRRQ
jgi:peptidoglycan/LPS O-acetylase OafA/YrhL